MRSLWRALALLVAASAIALASAPASAQSFLEKLFGMGTAAGPRAASPPQSQRPAAVRAPDHDWRRSERHRARDDDGDDGDRHGRRSDDGSGKVRTVCVRLCDGFYFPISNATSRRNLGRDAGKCRASCGEEAVLYHEPAPGGDTEKLVDGGGRPYTELRTAFRYRKSLVDGCTCKPEPWSEAALDRHRQYAAIESERKAALAARFRPLRVAADMTPRTGESAESAVEIARADALPELAVPELALPELAQPETGLPEPAITVAGLADATAPPPEIVAGGPVNGEPAPSRPVAPLFAEEPPAPALPPAVALAGAPAASSPAASLPSPPDAPAMEPDDPIVAPTREPVTAPKAPLAAIAAVSEPGRPARTAKPEAAKRQNAKARRDGEPDVRRASHKMAQAERPRPQAAQRPAKLASASAAAPSWLGKPKFTYPGDAPVRYR